MTEVTLEKPDVARTKRFGFGLDAQVQTNAYDDLRRSHILLVEEALNRLISLTEQKLNGDSGMVYRDQRRRTLKMIEQCYDDEHFSCLTFHDKQVYTNAIKKFGVYSIQSSRFEDLLTELFGIEQGSTVGVTSARVERPNTFVAGLQDWAQIVLTFCEARRDTFLSYKAPIHEDSLGLVRFNQFGTTLYRTDRTKVQVEEGGVTICNVTAYFTGYYVKKELSHVIGGLPSGGLLHDVRLTIDSNTRRVTAACFSRSA